MKAFLRWFPRVVMSLVALVLLGLSFRSDPSKLSEGHFFSDGATYYAMTWSLVGDFDLEYTATDLARIRREYPEGPSGIFLKRASGGFRFNGSPLPLTRVPQEEKRLYFGKAMTYPVAVIGLRTS